MFTDNFSVDHVSDGSWYTKVFDLRVDNNSGDTGVTNQTASTATVNTGAGQLTLTEQLSSTTWGNIALNTINPATSSTGTWPLGNLTNVSMTSVSYSNPGNSGFAFMTIYSPGFSDYVTFGRSGSDYGPYCGFSFSFKDGTSGASSTYVNGQYTNVCNSSGSQYSATSSPQAVPITGSFPIALSLSVSGGQLTVAPLVNFGSGFQPVYFKNNASTLVRQLHVPELADQFLGQRGLGDGAD